jgi:hypothetical protein
MTYGPDIMHPKAAEQVDFNELFVNYNSKDESKIKDTWQSIRSSSGKSYGEIELPESAPLNFLGLEMANKSNVQRSKRNLRRWGSLFRIIWTRGPRRNLYHQTISSSFS